MLSNGGNSVFLIIDLKVLFMIKLFAASFVLLSSLSIQVYAGGGHLVKGATVSEIEPMLSASGADGFIVSVTGGSGKCANERIVFPLSASYVENNSSAAHERLYAAALTSLATDMKVDIYNDIDGSLSVSEGACHQANYITLKK